MTAEGEYQFEILDELSEGNLVAIAARRSDGAEILIWAEIELEGREAILRQPFISGFDSATNRALQGRLKHRGVRRLAQEAMERFDVD